MKKQLPKRSELNQADTWDLSLLYKQETDYQEDFVKLENLVSSFKAQYQNKLNDVDTIYYALNDYANIYQVIIRLSHYESMASSVDQIDEQNQLRSNDADIRFQKINDLLTFFDNEINRANDDLLTAVYTKYPKYENHLKNMIKHKKHKLSDDVESALVKLSGSLQSSYRHYTMFKFADLKFKDFKVGDQSYPNSFTLFENEYEYEPNVAIRRAAYESFYEDLSHYNQGFSSLYQTHVKQEKALSELRGFDNVFDYLLDRQDVPKSFMDRQIDLIMDQLSKPMQKYAKHLKDIHGLDKMTYADLKIALDPEYEVKVSIPESKKLVREGLSILGPEYMQIVDEALENRWIDFPQNQGKSTGGFCASPYGANSFILLNWNGQMDEVMVLAHELGHAGHFQLANTHQNIYDTEPSLYFIEAPSTTNELLMNLVLEKKAKSNREKRYVKAVMIARTYYHNFVTHLLEAAFQREVYNRVDSYQPLSANVLNQIKMDVLKKFWGDTVEIPDYAGLTWMRQPHYYMGLYPYTYSAGLSIGTVVAKNILNGSLDPNKWLEVLKAGGTKSPFELTKHVNLDISHEDVLLDAIAFISQTIDEIVELSNQL